MLKGLFIIAQVNLRTVTSSYGAKGHALQQLEIHDYGPRPLKRLARSTTVLERRVVLPLMDRPTLVLPSHDSSLRGPDHRFET